MAEPLKILLVEDNPGDARLVREMLEPGQYGSFSVTHVTKLADALKSISENTFDAVLLDLALPDSTGVETVDRAREQHRQSDPPILVVTGNQEALEQALNSVQHGADDQLSKQGLRPEELVRAIHFAIERRRSRDAKDLEQQQARQAREIATLGHYEGLPISSITAQAYGFERLSDTSPDAFDMIVHQYAELILRNIEASKFELERKPSQELRVMAQRLGFLRAGPRDVVSLHIAAIKRSSTEKVTMSYAVAEEARMMLIELMGNLVSYYRDHVVPTHSRRTTTTSSEPATSRQEP